MGSVLRRFRLMKFKLLLVLSALGALLVFLTFRSASDPEVLELVGFTNVVFLILYSVVGLWCIWS